MLDAHRRDVSGIVIHPGFPADKLISAFSIYLNDYLLEAYSLNPTKRYQSKRKLCNKLIQFKN